LVYFSRFGMLFQEKSGNPGPDQKWPGIPEGQFGTADASNTNYYYLKVMRKSSKMYLPTFEPKFPRQVYVKQTST
jgi:hypothetical protein